MPEPAKQRMILTMVAIGFELAYQALARRAQEGSVEEAALTVIEDQVLEEIAAQRGGMLSPEAEEEAALQAVQMLKRRFETLRQLRMPH
jgi:hypothetical protein